MRRALKSALRISLGLASLIAASAAGLLAVAWIKPELLVNRGTLALMAQYAKQRGWVDLRWADAEVEWSGAESREKRLRVRLEGACARSEFGGRSMKLCARRLEVGAVAGFSAIKDGLRPYVRELGPLRLERGRWWLPPPPGKSDPPMAGTLEVRSRGPEVSLKIAQGKRRLEARVRVPSPAELLAGKLRFELRDLKQTALTELPKLEIGRCYGQLEGGWQARCRLQWPGVATVDALLVTGPLGQARAHAEIRVARFEGVVGQLAATRWAVPAPFQALRGTLALRADLPNLSGKPIVNVKLATRLRSPRQKLELKGEALLKLAAPLSLEAAVELSDVQLVLPALELAAPPHVLPDSRFTRARAQAPPAFRYAIRVRTRPAGPPVRLLSNFARAPIPVRADLSVSGSDGPRGRIAVERFPLELFRRSAAVEGFTLTLARPVEESRIDGAVTLSYADYRVSVALLSTVGKPVVRLQSDPPLPENQLWAALLFGRPLEELDAGGVQSVSDAQSAIADGAMSLLSLYALAATPVESVRYDPSSKALVARVRLAEGTSLEVGAATSGISQVGLRRRLGGPWVLSTEWQATGTLSTLLEWTRRY